MIHTKVVDEDFREGQEDIYAYQNEMVPDFSIEILDPFTNQPFLNEFFVRPHLKKCLQLVNTKYEVAVFTAGYDWYANPIIDKIDPTGTLIQHRYFR